MVRLQIQLEPEQHRAIRQRARRLGVSVSEVIRRCVDAELRKTRQDAPDDRARRLLAVAGKYADEAGAGRTAADHDELLVRAFKS